MASKQTQTQTQTQCSVSLSLSRKKKKKKINLLSMGVGFPRVRLSRSRRALADVPKGHFVVYVVGETEKRFVIPISYLKHPLFQKLLHRAEEEFGFKHGMGGIRVPSSEQAFKSLMQRLN
ncbi:hypothetical protein J5N97_023855 [Dioscorea zingiberensis]|uniref:Small auxin up regulated protein n=1 Tax=Dioscorea zingiberensis TaxID=325984 RepID=A0A9D5C5Y8_9LILI|nr:hypothetical protein J5N97_023855 [Dioscorea zingiberensis]